jgi:hypothetical protein
MYFVAYRYSTIWLARALPDDGQLITCEISEEFAKVESFCIISEEFLLVFRLLKKILTMQD